MRTFANNGDSGRPWNLSWTQKKVKTGKPYTRSGGAKALGLSKRLERCQREGADSKRP